MISVTVFPKFPEQQAFGPAPSIVISPHLPFYCHGPVPVISILFVILVKESRLTLYKHVKSPPQLLSILKITIPTSIPNSMIAGGIGKV
jgi:hypothetical protein